METPRTFPLNAWYVAAWSHEVGRREPLARTVCNKRMVLWRKADTSIAALEDACWHRLLPLSMGSLEGDDVVCRYHGLAFDGKGQCTRMPSQDTLNPAARCILIRSSTSPLRLGRRAISAGRSALVPAALE
jgi:vanillate O-demethylase monooxygenase subunit